MYQIFSQRIAGWLMFKGFKLISAKCNSNPKNGMTFTFDDSVGDLSAAVTQYNNRGKRILDMIGSIGAED